MGNQATAGTLRESSAWQIATAWHGDLRQRSRGDASVYLATDPLVADAWTIRKRYDWIIVELHDNVQLAATARAAILSWFWLSCCAGFSAEENPRFWKRVFGELNVNVSDAVTFFDGRDRMFPRVKILSDSAAPCLVFMGAVNGSRSKRLDRIREQLKPFMVESRLRRSIPVAIAQDEHSFVALWMDAFESVAGATGRSHVGELEPEFVLVSGVTGTCNMDEFEGPLRAVTTSIKIQVPVAECGKHDLSKYSASQRAAWIRSIFGIDGSLASVQVNSFVIPEVGDAQLAGPALWSAAPHAKAIPTLTPPIVSLADWAWLGYALFHPDTEHSTWQKLMIKLTEIPQDAIDTVSMMAKGNNLARILSSERGQGQQHSDNYITARLRDGAAVYTEPTPEAQVHYHLHGFTTVCLCIAFTTEVEGYIHAVVPGLGLGWIHATDIISLSSRPPGKPCLRKLQISMISNRDEPLPVLTTTLLSLIGTGLEALDLGLHRIEPPPLVVPMLRSCPSLKMLRIIHIPSWDRSSTLPSIKELSCSLLWEPCDQAYASLLCDLEAVHVTASRWPQHASVRALLQALPTIQYLHWSSTHEAPPISSKNRYLAGLKRTDRLLGDFKGTVKVDGPFSSQSRLAFISVARELRECRAIGRLGEDSLALIFSFATTTRQVPRVLWVDQPLH